MSKRELEDLVRESFSAPEDEAFDRRLLDVAGPVLDRLAERARKEPRKERSRFGSYRARIACAALAAAVAIGVACVWIFGSLDEPGGVQELTQSRGAVTWTADDAPLRITTPVGRVYLEAGRARVALVDARMSAEEREAMRKMFAIGAAALAASVWMGVEVFEGEARVETQSEDVRLAAGEKRAFVGEDPLVAEPGSPANPGEPPQVERSDASEASVSGGAPDASTAMLRGFVRDERGRAVSGAKIEVLEAAPREPARPGILGTSGGPDAIATFRTTGVECEWKKPSARTAVPMPVPPGLERKAQVQSAEDGSFALVGATDSCYLGIEAPGFASLVVFGVDPAGGAPLDLVLHELVALEVDLVDDQQIPLGGVPQGDAYACASMARSLVRLCLPVEGGLEAVIPLEGRGAGRFALLTAATAGAGLEVAWAGVETKRFDLAFDASTTMPLRFVLAATDFVGGIVRKESGEPFPGASVYIESFGEDGRRILHNTLSDDAGCFRLMTFRRSTRVRVEAASYTAIEKRNIAVPEGRLEFVMKPLVAAVIAGRVEDETGKPLADQEIRAWGEDSVFTVFAGGPTTKTGADGRFRFDGLQAGSYELTWQRAKPFVPIEVQNVKVAAGEVRDDLVIAAPIGGRIVLHCLDAAGEPLRRGRVELTRPRLLGSPEFVTSVWLAREDSAVLPSFDGVPPGRYAVVLDGGDQVEDVRLREGETVNVTLGGKSALEMRGRVERDGVPLANAEVVSAPPGGTISSIRRTRTDDAGCFVLPGSRPGRVLFRVAEKTKGPAFFAAADFLAAPDEVIVLSAPSGAVEITLAEELRASSSGARVRAVIEVLDGMDLRRTVPSTYRIAGEAPFAEGGVARIVGLAAGTYRLEAEVGGKQLEGSVELVGASAQVELR